MKYTFTDKEQKGDGFLKVVFSKEAKEHLYKATGVMPTLAGSALKPDEVSRRKFPLAVRSAIQKAKTDGMKKIVFSLSEILSHRSLFENTDELAECIGINLEMANYQFVTYRTEPKEGWKYVQEVIFVGTVSAEFKKGIEKGKLIGEEVNKTRELANTPGCDMTPTVLAQKAKESVQGLPVKVTVLGEKEMKKLGMGAVLGVGKGSIEESKFIIMEYRGASSAPVVLVGKGVTFDSGGLSLKPSKSMFDMNLDMSGGAAVIHTIAIAAKLKLKKHVIALIPSVENMPSGSSFRPGDVLRGLSGKTIEVRDTDAEGRVILSDALTYAERYKPAAVIDVATLTGAALVALGERASALLSPENDLARQLEDAGEASNDYVWRLPLWEEYESEVQGQIGDVTNTHNKDSRWGGTINGGVFLWQFAKKYRWAHIDMAPRMESIAGDNLASGAVGTPVRLLYKFLEKQ